MRKVADRQTDKQQRLHILLGRGNYGTTSIAVLKFHTGRKEAFIPVLYSFTVNAIVLTGSPDNLLLYPVYTIQPVVNPVDKAV